MTLKIETYDRKYLEAMVGLYNQQMAVEPHIAPLTPELFLKLVEPKTYFDPKGLFVAIEGGRVVGWCHACVAHATEIWLNPERIYAEIQMLVYRKENLHVGLALVAEAVNWLRPGGHEVIHAINAVGGYPFYRGLCIGGERLCPTTLPHVHLALSLSGFKIIAEGSLKVVRMDRRPQILQAAIDLEYEDGPLQSPRDVIWQSWAGFDPRVLTVKVDGQMIGGGGWVMLPYHAAKLGSPCVNIYMLSTNDQYKRKGIAAAVVSRMLAHGYDQGARIASVGTEMSNLAAHMTYHKFGMLVHCLVQDRRLDLKPQPPGSH
jgi:GNAT superfamily N-acetyltransferase